MEEKTGKRIVYGIIALAVAVFVIGWCVTSCNTSNDIKKSDELKEQYTKDYAGKPLQDVYNEFNDKGYEVKLVGLDGADRTQVALKAAETPTDNPLVIVECKEVKNNDKKVTFSYTDTTGYQDKIAYNKLWETFPSTLAESYIEDYGKSIYPYGFKFRGATKEKAINDTTWYIEGDCNITNAFGGVAKDQQFSAQATIDKNTGKVSVHDFQVF